MADLTKDEIARLRASMKWSRDKLEPFRRNKKQMLQQFLGANYNDEDGSDKKVMLNLLEMMVSTILTQLAGQSPQILITTPKRELKAQAIAWELAVTESARETNLADALETAVFNAMFCIGIVKTGLEHTDTLNIGDEEIPVTRPFARSVDPDDWVHDMAAKTWDDVQYSADRYRMPLEEAQKSPLFRKSVRAFLEADGKQTSEDFSDGRDASPKEFVETVGLWDVWMPARNEIITLADDDKDEILRTVEWDGPEGGPYYTLSMRPIPNRTMPLSPISVVWDMHNLANSMMRKVNEQAEAAKDILLGREGHEDDAQRIRDAKNGDYVPVADPNAVAPMSISGPNQTLVALIIYLKQLFSWKAGNLDLLAGLGPQSETATQDEMLNRNANKTMAAMQVRVLEFDRKIMRALAWYEFTEPLRSRQLTRQITGTNMNFTVEWSPEIRKGRFLDHNFDIVPFSMQYRSPGQRLQSIIQFALQVILPLSQTPAGQQQGVGIDINGLARLVARYGDLPELNEVITFVEKGEAETTQEMRQSPNTTRTNVRVNRPGATPRGAEDVLLNTLMGGQNQGAEQAGVMRAVG